jgi:hypothetical protein
MSGEYDDFYQIFLDDRAKLIIDHMKSNVLTERDAVVHELKRLQGW